MTMKHKDMTVPCDNGLINIRVGAVIMKDGRFLMVGNERADYLYSVGGRVRFGETAEEAVVREVYEETGIRMEIDRLGFIHENYFYGDAPSNTGKLIYEISFSFYMKTPDDFEPVSSDFTEDNCKGGYSVLLISDGATLGEETTFNMWFCLYASSILLLLGSFITTVILIKRRKAIKERKKYE